MKTLVVLSAFAAIATAAPTLPDTYNKPLSYQITPTFRREKKSPVEAHNDAVPVLEVSQNIPHSELSNVHKLTARTFGSKKPIIVKNKLGYHLYRDSDEEQAQADSQEKCTKEVKVKLCDEENLQAKSSNLNENFAAGEADVHQSENEMKHSIKMAKETVDNLQKMSNWKHSEFGSDAELHKDIEVARQALEHIQQNFAKLESLNMRTAILNDAQALQDAHLQITNDERMAQWKEAMDNIQKNTEIARNLENSLSSTDGLLSNMQKTELTTQDKSGDVKNADNLKMLTKNEKLNFQPKEVKMEHEPLHEEMKTAASEIKEAKIMNEQELRKFPRNNMPVKPFEELSQDTLFKSKSDLLGQNIHTEMHEKAKSSNFDSSLKLPVATVLGKEMEAKESTGKSSELIKMDVEANKHKQLENVDNIHGKLTRTMKSAEVNHESMQHNGHEFTIEVESKDPENNLKHSKSALIESDDKNMLEKASDHVSVDDQKKAELKSDSLTSEKTANFVPVTFANSEEHHGMDNLNKNKIHFQNTAAKSVDQAAHMSKQVSSRVLAPAAQHHSVTDLTPKMMEHLDVEHQHELHNFHPQAKAWQAGQMASMKNAAIEQNTVNLDSHPQAKNWQAEQKASMKISSVEQSIADLHNPETQRTVANFSPMSHHLPAQYHTHFPGPAHHHQIHHPTYPGHLHNMHHGLPLRAAESVKAQEKAVEMDNSVQSTLQVNMNEPSGKTALEHNVNWKQQQVGAARGAYGAYGLGGAGVGAIGASVGASSGITGGNSGGSGAIGIFPHANTGGCAIPLLLSCSPSVVPGSLAKSHSGYGVPAYRAGENFNIHSKRDTMKSNEMSAAKAQRIPTKVIQKIPYTSNKQN